MHVLVHCSQLTVCGVEVISTVHVARAAALQGDRTRSASSSGLLIFFLILFHI